MKPWAEIFSVTGVSKNMVVPTGIEPQTGSQPISDENVGSTEDYKENVQLDLFRNFPNKSPKTPSVKPKK